MKRKWIYYLLTVIAGCVYIGSLLNSQLMIVTPNEKWSSGFGWELVLAGWGALSYTIGSLFLAWLSDRFGRVICIGFSCAAIGILHVLIGWNVLGVYQLWHFFLYWGLSCVGFAVFFTSVEGLLSDYQDHTMPLARRLGLYCVSWCAGDTLGALVTGYTKQWAGPETVYRIMALLCFIAFALTLMDWFRHGHKKLSDTEIGVADIRPEAPLHARIGRIGIFFGSFAFSAISASFPRFGQVFHGFTEGQIGNLLGIILFAAAATFLWFPLWRGWHYNKRLQITLQMSMLLGLLMIFISPVGSIVFVSVSFIIFGFGWSVTYFFSIYYSLTVPEDHARSGGFHEAVLGLGNLVGPFAAVSVISITSQFRITSPSRVGIMAAVISFFAIVLSLGIQIIVGTRKSSGT